MITLATLHTAHSTTAQQVFDQVVDHLRKQKAVSTVPGKGTYVNSSPICAYRGTEGKKCAAGCLIADDEYLAEMEGCAWWGLVRDGVVPDSHRQLIIDLQRVHDVAVCPRKLPASTERWEADFRDVAANYKLEYKAA